MAGEAPRLTVLTRSYCHLCEEMIEALRTLQGGAGFLYEVRDVDDDPVLEARFGERVPVLLAGDEELCHYRLDPAAVGAWLAKFR
ncbi:MAG: glutaredoxin family protein [Burkholderiales bacterium]